MNTQINLRISDKLLKNAQIYAKTHGFENIQELIKQMLRERLFAYQDITKEELILLRKLTKVSNEQKLYGTEKELFSKLNSK